MAALSLPAFAATQPAESTVSVSVSSYREGDVPQRHVVAGDNQRYDIDIRQFRVLAPVGRNWSVQLGASRETMSGASPWATLRGPDGEADLIMSGATIEDSRTLLDISVTKYWEDRSAALTISRSDEDDYKAVAFSFLGEWSFNKDLTTLSLGASHSDDEIQPSDAAMFGRVAREEKMTRSVSVGVAQILNHTSAFYAGLSLTDHTGYLSDPYKLRDVRPDNRFETALSFRYRLHMPAPSGTLHMNYRYYHDNWEIASHTLHSSWYQDVGRRFQIVPNVRYYTQSKADFYLPVDDFLLPSDVGQSSDFRLSAYGAVTLGLKGILRQPRWALTVSLDRYTASEKYGLASESGHPARLDFTLTSIVFNFNF